MSARLRETLLVGGFLASAAIVLAVFLSLSGTRITPGERYRVRVAVDDAVQLARNADVRHAGVRIGKVDSVEIAPRGTVLRLSLEPEHGPIHRNARALVRAKNLAGENYLDLDPGAPSAGAIPSGGLLPIERSSEATQLEHILATLDKRRRREVRRILDALGAGTAGQADDLNAFVEGGAATMRSATQLNATLAADRRQLADLTDDLGAVAAALGSRRREIERLARGARHAAVAVASRDGRLRDTLDALPPFLTRLRDATARVGQLSDNATPVVADLADGTQQLVPAMRELRPATRAARSTMAALGAFNRAAVPAVKKLAPFSREATVSTDPIEDVVRQVRPFAKHLAPYSMEMGSVFSNMRATTQYRDAIGHFVRIAGLFTKSGLVGFFTPAQEEAYRALLKAGALSELTDTRGYNAYPKPGGADDLRLRSEPYEDVEADPPYRK